MIAPEQPGDLSYTSIDCCPPTLVLKLIGESMTNPYAPPTGDLEHPASSRDAIKARVARPATALIIMSSIQSVFVAIFLVSVAMVVVGGGSVAGRLFDIGIACLQFICLIAIAVGAAKLGFLESYRLARFGAILACIPFITPFILLGIPFGLWALRLLSDPLVREAYPDINAQLDTPSD